MTREVSLRCAPSPAARPSLLARLRDLSALWTQRRRLAELDEAALRDMGLTRSEVDAEARRPVWDAPAHWHR